MPPPAETRRRTDFLAAEVQDRPAHRPARSGATAKERLDKVLKGGLKIYTTFDREPAGPWRSTPRPTPSRQPKRTRLDRRRWWRSTRHRRGEGDGRRARTSPTSQSNIATSPDGRQTGSTFKVITLAAALANGYSPNDIVDGTEPVLRCRAVPGGAAERPNNSAAGEDGLHASTADRGLGQLRVRAPRHQRRATTRSSPRRTTMGITKDNLEPHPQRSRSAPSSRTPQTMATVMATIANGGVAPHALRGAEGRRRPTARCSSTRATDPGDQALDRRRRRLRAERARGVVTGGTGTNAAVDGQTIFGKTGTTDNRADAWFIGANPAAQQLATAVWFGNRTGTRRRRRLRWRLGRAGLPGVHEPGARRPARAGAARSRSGVRAAGQAREPGRRPRRAAPGRAGHAAAPDRAAAADHAGARPTPRRPPGGHRADRRGQRPRPADTGQ